MQRMPKKTSHHFFQLQRLVRSKYISLIFKPWQPCCFRTEMQYIHSPSMTTFATTLSFKSEKLNPKIMPLLVAGLRNLDNGWLLYEEICSACLLLGQAYILPTSGCNLSHSRKNFQIRWKKNWPEFSNVASKFYMCWSHERAQRKIRKPPVTTMTIF